MVVNRGTYVRRPTWGFKCHSVLMFLVVVILLFPEAIPVGQAEEMHSHEKKTTVHRTHSGHGTESTSEQEKPNVVRLSPEVAVRSGIKTDPVEHRHLVKEIQTVGEITYDERRVKMVSAWVGGRIDKLYVDFTGVNVKKGDRLAELYSPELLSTQEEYLLALKAKKEVLSLGNIEASRSAIRLASAARERLLLWGITEEQIARLEKTGKVSTHMTIHAPIEGIVIHKRVLEGQYVKTGDPLYTIADLSVVWALADIYEYELDWVKVGQKVSIMTPTCPGVPFGGKVSFIDPFLDIKTRSVKVRMPLVKISKDWRRL